MSFEIRAATRGDLEALFELSAYLDSVNLPHDRAAIEGLLEASERSFAGDEGSPARREYVFVLWDLERQRPIGTSAVIGQLGRRDAPYIYFDVDREEKYSATLDRYFVHTVLTCCYSYDGPTEIGGLVMHPEYRRRPERLGTLISYVRFLFIAARRADMRDEVLAELLPPLGPGAESHLWEAIGRRFTGLTYREADRLSKSNKEFIRGLFPDAVYATLLSDEARAVIGEVGEQTRGVEKMLRRQGFHYAHRVDPFDGGPHFLAATDEVPLVRDTRRLPLRLVADSEPERGVPALLGLDARRPPYFRAALGRLDGETALLPETRAETLAATAGDLAWSLPLWRRSG